MDIRTGIGDTNKLKVVENKHQWKGFITVWRTIVSY
jgi:hypothetical protein